MLLHSNSKSLEIPRDHYMQPKDSVLSEETAVKLNLAGIFESLIKFSWETDTPLSCSVLCTIIC